MNDVIRNRLNQLRHIMAQRNVEAYIVPTADFHGSEFIGAHFKTRQYLSGFTGSAGTLVVTADAAGLWTDGRYFLQAEQELEGSGIKLFPMNLEDSVSIEAFLNDALSEQGIVGADGRTISAAWALELSRALGPQRILQMSEDLADGLWPDRPPLPVDPVYILPEQYAGRSAADKLAWLRGEMQRLRADIHVIADLAEIAWLFNLRGADIPCVPVFLSYAVIGADYAKLFLDPHKLTPETRDYFNELGVTLLPYEGAFQELSDISKARVLLDPARVNYALYSVLSDQIELIERDSPILLAKAIKNPVEQENLRKAHLMDGLALTKLLYWLKTTPPEQLGTELQVAERVNRLRMEHEHCIGPSFGTLAGYGPHGAIIHFEPTQENQAQLKPRGLLLLDSGGHYLEGTTDVTRTVALGPLTEEEKKHFTLVLQGMLNLSSAVFPHGCRGFHLDVLAREPLWTQGLDYGHGTGHGIGYLSCVHEPPVGFSWLRTQRYDTGVLEPGMVISDEPGVYIPGSHGIRLENQLLCREAEAKGFLAFETLTLAPIDLDAVDMKWLDESGRVRLNNYHQRVYQALAPYLDREEREWLASATRAI